MNQITTEQIKQRVVPILKEAGIIRSSLFGSYVTGDQTKESDVDLLVEFPTGKSLFDLIDLQNELQEVLGKNVDVITYNSVSPYLKKYIFEHQMQLL
jgi:predicted nucleotidyltransferase